MNSEVQLLGITYSEFDNKVGPQLKYSYPVDVLSKEAFEAYSDYVIVSKQLCEKLIVVTFDDVQFLNYSVAIDNVKYHRNALLFAFGFVLARGVDTEPYGAVLEKIASTFVNLEVSQLLEFILLRLLNAIANFSGLLHYLQIESEFLFQPSSRNRIQDFLRVLFFQLNEKNEAFMDLGFNNSYLAVKLYRAPMKPADINDWDVPIFRRDRIDLSYLPWDISYQHLIPHIDGVSHVKKIVFEVGMDIDSVKRSLKLLLFHGSILISDVFKFTNIYKLHTEEAISLLSNTALMHEMRVFSAFVGKNSANLPSANQIIAFLLLLQPNKTIQQILLDALTPHTPAESGSPRDVGKYNKGSVEAKGEKTEPDSTDTSSSSGSSNSSTGSSKPLDLQNLDISRLIAFALSHGLVRRVHEYPIYVPQHPFPTATRGAPPNQGVSQASSTDMLLAHNIHHPSMASMDSHRTQSSLPAGQQSHGNYFSQGSTHPSQAMLHEPNSAFSQSSSYTRSNNLPMPGSSHQNSSAGYLQNMGHYGHHEVAASVGLSGVLSAGNSLNVGPSVISKEIGIRKSSFGPGTQDRNVAEALSVQAQHQSQQQTQAQSAQNASSLMRSPRFSHPGGQSAAQSSGATAVAQTEASSLTPPPGGTASHRPSLHRLTSRSKMTAGQNFLHNNHLHLPHAVGGGGSGANSHTPSVAPPVATRLEVRDILHRLTGREHMDTICCRYDLTYHEVVNFPGVQLIYK